MLKEETSSISEEALRKEGMKKYSVSVYHVLMSLLHLFPILISKDVIEIQRIYGLFREMMKSS